MTNGQPTAVPYPVVRRLARYHSYIQRRESEGVRTVSSRTMSNAMGLTSSTVRQDLLHIDFTGMPRKGYDVAALRRALDKALGTTALQSAIIVGAGNLGTALSCYEELERRGFAIVGLFDSDHRKVGKRAGKLSVMHTEDLRTFIADNDVRIGIIAVPAAASQSVADILVVYGIRGILNLTQTHILTPGPIAVVDAQILGGLLELSHAMLQKSALCAPRPKAALQSTT